ncbi:hypothetical protein JU72_02233 [Listeria monocytogenes]|nr:hypothetical protein T283_09070 [Listeria monocytogenes N53-1]RKA80871.1 hypothetical protein AFX76_01919 [Listeria monocytogenes]RKC19901.1 hypothetical protein JU72_02233 [Listeria monocytogenes]RKC37894.1 hypothetical protein AF951_03095 [Listeria monocytogenes]RKC38269.1 hypothetical protein AF788_02397 [Listeria monocytogenes]
MKKHENLVLGYLFLAQTTLFVRVISFLLLGLILLTK